MFRPSLLKIETASRSKERRGELMKQRLIESLKRGTRRENQREGKP
jgi:hypothetical protein